MSPRNASVERLTLDAAALVRSASPMDWPGGFVVVAERLPHRVRGLSVGCGLHLASVYGCRPGVRAVLVNVEAIAANTSSPTPTELATLETTVCHEAAHALTTGTTGSVDTVAGALDAARELVAGYDATQVARQHCPRWAAAFWLLANGAARFRRWRADAIRERVATQLATYGYTRADVERVTRGADTERPLREVLAAGGPAATLLASMLPSIETRAAAIAATGIVGVGSTTEVAR